ncbi:tyrosine-protein kinase STYK1-like isoform X3 [Takifugu rubripes]|nr:tyrosine-protein kinase STYK1-like isoform X3 [Takifugu rubripes]|eukprot:XP_011618114.1 PREDICTED: tyrosine-protein kinase STYK1-like isoform X3 [Takifugu rubripes]
MSFNSIPEDLCAADDRLCIAREYNQAVIIVPTLLLLGSAVILVTLCFMRCRTQQRTRSHPTLQRGIDAPAGINPLEHEELPMSVKHQNVRPTLTAAPRASTEQYPRVYSQVKALPLSFSIKADNMVTLYRACVDNRNVVLRVLKETANHNERQHFLGFASFLSGLGPHPFLPNLLGMISVEPPLMMVMEDLQHQDLLGYLWKCRQDGSLESSHDMTEKRIFIMATQVASALEYLHSQECIHGNVGARSVLIGGDLTAKLWGFGSAYRRTQPISLSAREPTQLRKWQAPEVLSMRAFSHSSDVWSFGILLYEMVTLGDPPFAKVFVTELLQYLQRGKHLKRPASCSHALLFRYSLIRSCCHWSPQHRLSMTELIQKLRAGERSANDRRVLRVPEPLDFEKYMREAGYGETYNYAVL